MCLFPLPPLLLRFLAPRLRIPGLFLLLTTIQLSTAKKKGLFNAALDWRAQCQKRGVAGKMNTAVTQPSQCHQAAAIINERIKRSTQGAKKVDNDLCLPKGKII